LGSSEIAGSTKETSYISTGIPGLDELLEGRGFPSGHLVFMLGSPGSGKTTAAFQFLTYGCEIGEKGVYVTLDETPEDLVKNMQRYGLDIEENIREKKLSMVDATPIRRFPGKVQLGAISIGKRDFSLASLIGAIQAHVKEMDAKRLVIDPITSFLLQFPQEEEVRTACMDLMEGIAPLGCTTLFLSELKDTATERKYQFEEYLAHGVILARRILRANGMIQSIQIEKMRGVDHDVNPHPYKFTPKGIEVFPSEQVL